jgi:hypothetical protein
MYVCICVCVHMYIYICIYVCVCVCMYVCMYVCVYVYVCLCMYVYMYLCVYVCTKYHAMPFSSMVAYANKIFCLYILYICISKILKPSSFSVASGVLCRG